MRRVAPPCRPYGYSTRRRADEIKERPPLVLCLTAVHVPVGTVGEEERAAPVGIPAHVGTTSAPRRHHVSTTSAPRRHHVSTVGEEGRAACLRTLAATRFAAKALGSRWRTCPSAPPSWPCRGSRCSPPSSRRWGRPASLAGGGWRVAGGRRWVQLNDTAAGAVFYRMAGRSLSMQPAHGPLKHAEVNAHQLVGGGGRG